MKRKPNRDLKKGSTPAPISQRKTAPQFAPTPSKLKSDDRPSWACFALFPGDGKEIDGVADDYVEITRRQYATLRRAFGRDGIAFCTVKAGLETAMGMNSTPPTRTAAASPSPVVSASNPSPVSCPLNELESAVSDAVGLIAIVSEKVVAEYGKEEIELRTEPEYKSASVLMGYTAVGLQNLAQSVPNRLLAALQSTIDYCRQAQSQTREAA